MVRHWPTLKVKDKTSSCMSHWLRYISNAPLAIGRCIGGGGDTVAGTINSGTTMTAEEVFKSNFYLFISR